MELKKYCKKNNKNNVVTGVRWVNSKSCRGWVGIKETIFGD